MRACAEAGVDAVIVQDLGVARLVRAIAPELPIHASTQMTCTDASSVELARELGASASSSRASSRSTTSPRSARATDVELEVFVHGALCISYSGQCLTSEAIGGRSANRGACAQACRLPYELVVDGELRELGDRAYLLSPEDLEATARCRSSRARASRRSRSKDASRGPSTSPRRRGSTATRSTAPSARWRRSRRAADVLARLGPWLPRGVDHQRLVEGRACDHRGLDVGEVRDVCIVRGKSWVRVLSSEFVARRRRPRRGRLRRARARSAGASGRSTATSCGSDRT